MTHRLLVPSLLLALIAAGPARAQEGGLSFLRLGVDAAAGSMGEAQVAYSRGAFSAYWNPAGLAATSSNAAAVSHQRWIADLRTYALGTRLGFGQRGGVGLFALALDGGTFEIRDQPGDAEGEGGAQFVAAGAGYGRAFGPLYAGVAAKFVRERIYTESANGYALDFGAQADLLGGGLRLGAALQNLGSMDRLADEATTLPLTLRAGVTTFPFRLQTEADEATLLNAGVSVDVSHVFPEAEEQTRLHTGLAVEVMELITVRAGYISGNAARRFSGGLGLRYQAFQFDYAYLPLEGGYGDTAHMITLGYGW